MPYFFARRSLAQTRSRCEVVMPQHMHTLFTGPFFPRSCSIAQPTFKDQKICTSTCGSAEGIIGIPRGCPLLPASHAADPTPGTTWHPLCPGAAHLMFRHALANGIPLLDATCSSPAPRLELNLNRLRQRANF